MASIEELSIQFPVICLGRDSSICVASNASELRSCNATAFFSNHYFDKLRVIDAKFAQYTVTSAELRPAFGPLRRAIAKITNQKLSVQLGLEKTAEPSEAEAKAEILRGLDRAKELLEASADISVWRRRVQSAPHMDALVKIFA